MNLFRLPYASYCTFFALSTFVYKHARICTCLLFLDEQRTYMLFSFNISWNVASPPTSRIVDSLSMGFTRLRDLLIVRAHDDVERKYGTDSMVVSSLASMQRQARRTKVEIEAYSCIVVEDEVTESGYVDEPGTWFLEWLFRLLCEPRRLWRRYLIGGSRFLFHFLLPFMPRRNPS